MGAIMAALTPLFKVPQAQFCRSLGNIKYDRKPNQTTKSYFLVIFRPTYHISLKKAILWIFYTWSNEVKSDSQKCHCAVTFSLMEEVIAALSHLFFWLF